MSASESAALTASVASAAVTAGAAAGGARLRRLRTYGSSSSTGTAPIEYNTRHADPAATSKAATPTTFPPCSR